MSQPPRDRRESPPLERIRLDGRSREEIDADVRRVHPSHVSLSGALTRPELPEIVAALRARGAQPSIAIDDERISTALAQRLSGIGVTGIEIVIEGGERLHDRCHGLGSWRGRLASARAARKSGLGARAVVRVESAVIGDLPSLLDVLGRVASQVVLLEAGPLTPAERERAIASAAALDSVHVSGFALHGPRPEGAPIPLERAHWHAVVRGIRVPRLEVGTRVRATPELGTIAAAAGGLRALGLGLAAMGAPARDLPPCLGGEGAADAPTTHVASCLPCPARARCEGIPTEIADLAQGLLEPRRAWRPLPPGARVHVAPPDHVAALELIAPPLVRRLEELGCRVATEPSASRADADLVVVWSYEQAAEALDGDAPPSARIVVADFRMLFGRDAIARRTRDGWPDARLEIVSAFPSFAHLYRNTRIPLERITFRPMPIGPVAPRPTSGWAFAGSGPDHDAETFAAVVRSLGPRGPSFRTFDEGARDLSGVEVIGDPTFERFVDHVARARFVALPLRWHRDVSTGGAPLAIARAFARPIVTTRVPMALDHLEDGVDALLVDPGDPTALAEAVLRLHRDDALRRRLSEKAAERSRSADAHAWAEELVRGALRTGTRRA